MAKLTYKNETDRAFRFDTFNDEGVAVEKILDAGASAKLEKNDYLDGLVAQGLFSTKEKEEKDDSQPTNSNS